MRTELHRILDLAQSLEPAELPELLGELRTIELVAHGRLTGPAVVAKSEQWLDAAECAARMHKSKDYVYRNSRRWPFTRRIGKSLLFSSAGLDAYLKRSK